MVIVVTDTPQEIRFLISGGLATLLHFSVMGLLIRLGISGLSSTMVGAGVGALANYILQYKLTFCSRQAHFSTFPSYFRVCVVAWSTNALLFYLFYTYLLLNAFVAQVCTTSFVTVMNFYLYRETVFNERSAD